MPQSPDIKAIETCLNRESNIKGKLSILQNENFQNQLKSCFILFNFLLFIFLPFFLQQLNDWNIVILVIVFFSFIVQVATSRINTFLQRYYQKKLNNPSESLVLVKDYRSKDNYRKCLMKIAKYLMLISYSSFTLVIILSNAQGVWPRLAEYRIYILILQITSYVFLLLSWSK